MTVRQLHPRGMTSGASQAKDAGGGGAAMGDSGSTRESLTLKNCGPTAKKKRSSHGDTATCRETLVGTARLAKGMAHGWAVWPCGRVGPVEDAKASCKLPCVLAFVSETISKMQGVVDWARPARGTASVLIAAARWRSSRGRPPAQAGQGGRDKITNVGKFRW